MKKPISAPIEQLLGFSKQEQKLYQILTDDPMSVAEIARKSALPRMTTHYILRRLQNRRLIKRVKLHNRFYYRRVSQENIFRRLLSLPLLDGTFAIPVTDSISISLHVGLKSIFLLHKTIADKQANQRVYTVQTSESTRRIVRGYTKQEIDQLHSFISDNRIISEDIVEEDFFEIAKAEYGKSFTKALNGFLDRMSIAYILPRYVITFENDMVIYNETVVFIDWREAIAIKIRNKETAKLCMELFESYKVKGRRVEYKELAKEYLDNPT